MQHILADVCLGVGELVGRWGTMGVGWHAEVGVQAAGWGAAEWGGGPRAGCGLVDERVGGCRVGGRPATRAWVMDWGWVGGGGELAMRWAHGVWVEEGSCRH